MDRMNEYERLINDLNDTPPALEGAVRRAQARYRRTRIGRICGIPAASLAGAAAAFVLLVNLSLPFARACGSIPILKDLAVAAAFSPSLKAAVENDYVQPMGLTQTENGLTVTVEYVIVDQKQVNIFYTLAGPDGDWTAYPALELPDGTPLGAAVSYGSPRERDDALRKITADFLTENVPSALTLVLEVFPAGESEAKAPVNAADSAEPPMEEDRGTPAARLALPLTFDPAFTETGVTYSLNQTIALDGQTVTVTDVEIYPTHLRLNLEDHPDNTAWLRGLDFYLTDEGGNRYDKISNGITATGSGDSPFYASHRLESSYFGNAQHLTIHITGAVWLDKDRQYAAVDIVRGTAEGLPQGVTLGSAERRGSGVRITLFAPLGGQGSGLPIGTSSYSVSDWSYRDPEGEESHFYAMSSTGGFRVDGEYEAVDGVPAGCFSETFTLPGYHWDTVELGMSFSRFSVLDAPVEVPIK